MNYIVFDLEWNQSPDGKEYANKEIPFEIIEIGAVKLDSEFNIVSVFEKVIRPQIYQELHHKIKEMLDISSEDLEKGVTFVQAFQEFISWCGDNYVFCTWGNMDLLELQRNMNYYNIQNTFEFPLVYYDLQKLFSILYEDGKSRRTLEYAVQLLKLEESASYHRAVNDAKYTAQVAINMDFSKAKQYYSIDYYTIPQDKEHEIYAVYDNYEKYISRGFEVREDIIYDKTVSSVKCYKCGRNCKKLIKWFSNNNKSYYGLFSCAEHGYMKGRIRTNQNDSGMFFAIKILKLTDEDGADKIRDRQKINRERRKRKRANRK